MIDEKGERDYYQWLLVANTTAKATAYLKLHTELTQLAFAKVRELQSAKDIASECLIHCWQCIVANTTAVSTKYIINELNRLCCLYLREKRTFSVVEEAYYSGWSSPISIWQKFRMADRMEIIRFFPLLEGGEKIVIQLMIFEEMDLSQIAEKIRKPLATVKVLRDRAIYQLKKRLNPKALPINQLYSFISLFSGIAVAT